MSDASKYTARQIQKILRRLFQMCEVNLQIWR